jgi:hypothetical protein
VYIVCGSTCCHSVSLIFPCDRTLPTATDAFPPSIEIGERASRRVRLLDPPVPQTNVQLGHEMEGRSPDDAKAAQGTASSIVSHESPTMPAAFRRSMTSKSLAMRYGSSSTFDASSFTKYMKNTGRAYRNRALALISICRTFVQTQEQTPESCAVLRR